jgi:NAD(P)-dependent dehydrogenase (short-subunit alcohol dehydrogenase family)
MPTMAEAGPFAGKVAIVTGASQGLGEACARAFVAGGLTGILVCGRNAERIAKVADDLARLGASVEVALVDLADPDAGQRIVASADSTFGWVDIVVNAAAATDRGSVWETTPELWDRMMATNVRTPYFLSQAAMNLMRRQGDGGSIVNIGSLSAYGGQSELSAYSISKGALATATKSLAYAGAPHRIRVNAINFGWMQTAGEDAVQRDYYGAGGDWAEEAAKWQPFGRLISPAEAARSVLFLASDESGLMTGSIIDYDQRIVGSGLLSTPSLDDRGQAPP